MRILIRLIRADGKIHRIGTHQQKCGRQTDTVRNEQDSAEHQPVQKRKQQKSDEPPAQRAFQAQNPLIIERLIGVIPPEGAEQAQHQPRGEVFEQRCQNGSHKIEQHIIAGKRTQQRKAEHCAEAVDDTERQMRKAAVLPPALLPAYDDALHHPAQKAVKEECVDQHMGRHRCGIKNRTHVLHPFCFAACSRDR